MKPAIEARNHLNNLIKGQLSTPHRPLPTEREIARKASLSVSTVNRVCRSLCEEGLLLRQGRRLYIGEKALKGQGSLPIAIVSNKKIGDILVQSPFSLDIEPIPDPARYQLRIYEAASEGRPGILTWPFPPIPKVLDFVQQKEIPLVTVGQDCPNQDNVEVDWNTASHKILTRLAQTGHKRVLFGAVLARNFEKNMVSRFENAAADLDLQPVTWCQNQSATHNPKQNFKEFFLEVMQSAHPVTAAILTEADLLKSSFEVSDELNISVPKQLSLSCLFARKGRDLMNRQFPHVKGCDELLMRAATSLLTQRMLEKQTFLKRSAPAVTLKVSPEVSNMRQIDASARPRNRPSSLDTAGCGTNLGFSRLDQTLAFQWLDDCKSERQAKLRRFNSLPHAHIPGGELVPVNLSKAMNRSLRPYRQWFGNEPLLHLEAGRLIAHSIPFEIESSPNSSQGPRVAIFAGSNTRSRKEKELPTRESFDEDRPARAIYFLHACAYSENSCHFADYEIHNQAGESFHIPLVSGGHEPGPNCNIQDWWLNYPPVQTAMCLPYCVAEDDDPFLYERYLYTMEWINPSPEIPLRKISVRSQPDSVPQLGLLGITLAQ